LSGLSNSPHFDHLLSLGLNFSYENLQSVPHIILIITNKQSSCYTYVILGRTILYFFYTRRKNSAVSPKGEHFLRNSFFSVLRTLQCIIIYFSLTKICFHTFLCPVLRSSNIIQTESQLTIFINFIPSVFVACLF
jgi:hypothetical protein